MSVSVPGYKSSGQGYEDRRLAHCFPANLAFVPSAALAAKRGKMPRGFLVKRSKKISGTYRVPCDASAQQLSVAFPPAPDPASAHVIPNSPPDSATAVKQGAEVVQSPCNVRLDETASWSQLPHSPVQPTGAEMKTTLFKRYPSSPVSGESFPVAASLSSMEKLLLNHNPFMTPEGKLRGNLCPPTFTKCPSKKSKVTRKLNFTDDVTTSPVLGLKIKAEDPESRKSRSPLAKRPPLGEFICQLCKEHYPDPFALAQHKCSRIVRVEYRCPECDKVFSCPANLASHRRWHKPRAAGGSDGQGGKKAQSPQQLEGKENSGAARTVPLTLLDASPVQHQQAADSSQRTDQHQPPADSSLSHSRAATEAPVTRAASDDGEEEEEAFDCPYCHKRFRRHAYLRKHLLSHQQPYKPCLERGHVTYPCALCGVHFPSIDIRDKHRLWHVIREERLIPLEDSLVVAEGGQKIYPCERCPAAFFSSPGLALHVSKCHSADNPALLLMPLPMGPGC